MAEMILNDIPFADMHKELIKESLKNYNPESVKIFIEKLCDCWQVACCLLDQPDTKTYRNDRRSMLNILEKSSELLDTIRKGYPGLYHLSKYSLINNQTLAAEHLECQELAVTTDNLLRLLIKKIKRFDYLLNEQIHKGRPSADSKEIVTEIAKIWESCFSEKPSQYRDGPFVTVIKIIFEGLNLPSKDPQRSIRAALK